MTKSARKASVASQHPDSKGVNVKRDSRRAKGTGAVTTTRGHGTSKFRRKRAAVE